MLAVLYLLSPALAYNLTCDELVTMAKIGIPTQDIVDTVKSTGIPSAELACIAGSSLPDAVKEAAAGHAVAPTPSSEPPAPSPGPAEGPAPAPAPGIPPALLPPRAPGGLDPTLKVWMREDPCSPVNLMQTLPDPGVAMVLSMFPGYGAGHFYARKPGMGLAMLLTQGAATAVTIIGTTQLRNADPADPPTGGAVVGGATALAALHLFDFGTSYWSAQGTRAEQLTACGW